MKPTSRFIACAAASLAVAAASPSLAQTTAPAASAAPAQAAAPTAHSEPELRQYARAWMELTTIQREMQPQIQGATGEARATLERQAAERMRTAVESQGLDSDTFNRISAAMRTDAALSSQVDSYVQEAAAAQDAGAGN